MPMYPLPTAKYRFNLAFSDRCEAFLDNQPVANRWTVRVGNSTPSGLMPETLPEARAVLRSIMGNCALEQASRRRYRGLADTNEHSIQPSGRPRHQRLADGVLGYGTDNFERLQCHHWSREA